jgi:aryl-alcohol dehydrogenase-like predicted oxidoreductase
MLTRSFGKTGLVVSALGFGAGHIGDPNLREDTVGELLNSALDQGITLIDMAPAYGLSEERIGRHLSYRRGDYVLSTKVGYGVPGLPDWSYDTIIAGVDQALQRCCTDYLDIVHLHSCPQDLLQQGAILDALNATVQSGKVRVAAYSGENEALAYAIQSGRLGGLQTSLNLCDQRGIDNFLPQAQQQGMGIIAKRPLANGFWRFQERPIGQYAEPYWLRWQQMALTVEIPFPDLALRFAVYATGADSCIVGTHSLDHLCQNIAILNQGPLPPEVVTTIREAFRRHNDNWVGQV